MGFLVGLSPTYLYGTSPFFSCGEVRAVGALIPQQAVNMFFIPSTLEILFLTLKRPPEFLKGAISGMLFFVLAFNCEMEF